MPYDYDVLVLGGGPAGASVVSICGWLNKSACVVEPRGAITPAPTGAISKIHRACGSLHGDPFGNVRVEWSVVEDHLAATLKRVGDLPLPHEGKGGKAGVTGQLTVVEGIGRLEGEHTVSVLLPDGNKKMLTSEVIIVATGSKPSRLKGVPFDGRFVFDR
jgi:pyruvate/2-oxoglutarate dehydrogenase complex dihydrolipoamide dehydrogenase (E3) component